MPTGSGRRELLRTRAHSACEERDLSAKRGSFAMVWAAPAALAFGISIATDQVLASAAWSAAFLWLGLACLYNARRCGRVHCYVSGPILLAGSFAAAARGFGALDVGIAGIVGLALALAGATYLLELVWGRYRRRTP